ncbi:MAG TPA: hypothetical protein VE869_09035, partial [Gemmatimonas sp.]|nr:hypothetical protein [Gemmatimonas sp.]
LIAAPKTNQLMRADQLVYFLIRDSWPERPVYFSRTAGGYPYELGLERYMITQGMAKRLSERMVVPGKDTIIVPGEGFVDVKRSYDLWSKVFTGTKSLAERDGWVDNASVGIPDLYVISGITLAEALASTGRVEASNTVFNQAKTIARSMRREAALGLDRIASPTGPDAAGQELLVPRDTTAAPPGSAKPPA